MASAHASTTNRTAASSQQQQQQHHHNNTVASTSSTSSTASAQFLSTHPYVNVLSSYPASYFDYENFSPQWHRSDDYSIIRKIGRGKYSEVFLGINDITQTLVVIKVLKPVKKKKIKREILILTRLNDCDNIIRLHAAVRDDPSRYCSLICEYVNAVDFKDLFPTLSASDIRLYLYFTLSALDYAHSRGIMHRDVKPHNIMIEPHTKTLKLIDWGLAEFYHANTEYNVRVASRYFKSPELLCNYRYYDYSMDIWSVGCVFAGMLFNVHPFFKGAKNIDQLIKIAKVFGTKCIKDYTQKYRIDLVAVLSGTPLHDHPRRSWNAFMTEDRATTYCTPAAIDLLNEMLVVDHAKRIDTKRALKHRYFDGIQADIDAAKKLQREAEAVIDGEFKLILTHTDDSTTNSAQQNDTAQRDAMNYDDEDDKMND